MYRKVLVPLDGSPFSECSLEHVRAIATGCNVPEVILFRVVEPLSSNETADSALERGKVLPRQESENKSLAGVYTDETYSDSVLEKMGRRRAEAESYISKITENLVKEGIAAKGEVASGKEAETILDYAEKNDVDLIIITTHGRSGISRWAFGSVADRVVNHATVPVLIVSPPGCRINWK